MAGELARLGIQVDVQGGDQAIKNLDKLSASSAKAEQSTDALSKTATKATAALRDLGTSSTKATDSLRASSGSATSATTGLTKAQEQYLALVQSGVPIHQRYIDAVGGASAAQALWAKSSGQSADLQKTVTQATAAGAIAAISNATAVKTMGAAHTEAGEAGVKFATLQDGINKSVGLTGTAFKSASASAGVFASSLEGQAAIAASAASEGTKLANVHGTLNTQAMALSHSIRSTVEQLALGVPPTQVLTQQFAHLSYAASGPGGLSGAMTSVWTILKSLISPAFLVVGAIGAVAAALIVATYDFVQSEAKLATAAGGLGRAANTTVGQLQSIAEAAASGGKVTVTSAENMEAAFLQTGKIGVQNYGSLIDVVKDYAAQTGQSTDDAAKSLAKMVVDPAKGIDELAASLGGVSASTRAYVQDLAAQGRTQEAQSALIKAARDNLDDYRTHLDPLQRKMDSVGQTAETWWEGIGSAIDHAYNSLSRYMSKMPHSGWDMIPQLFTAPDAPAAKPSNDNQALINQATDAVKNANAANGVDQIYALRDALAAYKKALDAIDSGVTGANSTQRAAVAQQVNNLTGALDSLKSATGDLIVDNVHYASSAQIKNQQDAVALAAITARTGPEKAAIAREQTRLSLIGQEIDGTQRKTQIDAAATQVLAQSTEAISRQSQALTENAQQTLNVADAWLKGSAAAMIAQATQQATAEHLQDGVDVSMRASQILKGMLADQIEAASQAVNATDQQTAAQQAANAAVASGAISYSQVNSFMSEYLKIGELTQEKNAALASGNDILAAKIQKVIDATKEADQRSDTAKDQSTIQGITDQMDEQAKLAGMSADQRERENAVLQAQHSINGTLSTDDANAIRAHEYALQLQEQIGKATDGMVTDADEFPDGFTEKKNIKSEITAQLEEILS